MERLDVLDLKEESVDKFISCFKINGSPKNRNKVEWQFFNNPLKTSYVDIAYDRDKNKTAAIYAISPIKFKVGDSETIGAQSLDTITDKDYRGKGLFVKLAKDVYKKAENKGLGLVYGFPNGNSIHGFKRKLNWEVLDPLPFLIKPLRSKYFTDKIGLLNFLPNFKLSFFSFKEDRSFKIKEEFLFPIQVDAIWNKFSKQIDVAVVRNKEYLDWRYINKPNENYKILHCYSNNNEYLGFVVYSVKEKHNGKIGYIMELMFDVNQPKIGEVLLKKAIHNIKEKEADCVLCWCFEHSMIYSLYKKMFFIKMPEKIRPIELHFGLLTINKKIINKVSNRKNWFISYSDSDTV